MFPVPPHFNGKNSTTVNTKLLICISSIHYATITKKSFQWGKLFFHRKSSHLQRKNMTRITCLFLPQMQLSQITLCARQNAARVAHWWVLLIYCLVHLLNFFPSWFRYLNSYLIKSFWPWAYKFKKLRNSENMLVRHVVYSS